MKKLALLATAAIALTAASSANAAITVSAAVADDLFGTSATFAASGQTMLWDFDSIADPNVTFVGNEITTTPDPITSSAPPPYSGGVIVGGSPVPVDPTDYASVQGGGTATFSTLAGTFKSFSFYLGSPDTYNRVTFNFNGGGSQVFQGADIWGGFPPGNGDRSLGYRVFYDFGGAQVSSITFESSANAFEFDGLAGAIPEPATWAMMILGFGAAGTVLRTNRRRLASVAA
jgi:hypothetical protein